MAGEPLFRQGLILGDSETDPAMKSLVLSVRGVGSASDTAVPSEKAVASALGGLGAGDVHGPASNTSGAVALYDGTTGKYIKDGPVPGANNGLATLNSSGKLAENLDASKVTSGVFDIARIPPAALERIYDAANDAARFALTTAEVQNGDTVKVLSPEPVRLFLVVDDSQLSSEAGYQQYAAAITWDNIIGKPNVVVGPVSGTDSHIVLFDGTSGALVKDSGVALAGLQMALSNAAGSDQALLSGSTLRGLAEGSGITMTEAAGVITINSTAVGTGDVVGPSSAVDSHLAAFDTATGKKIKDSGIASSLVVQATTSGDLPALGGQNLTKLQATSVIMPGVNINPAYSVTLDNMLSYIWSSGRVSGFELTDNGNGTVNVAAGVVMLRSGDTMTPYFSPLYACYVAATANLSMTDNATNYIYAQYHATTPTIGVGTDITAIHATNKVVLYSVTMVGTQLDYISVGSYASDFMAKYAKKIVARNQGAEYAYGCVTTEVDTRKLSVTGGAFYYVNEQIAVSPFNTNTGSTFTYAYRSASANVYTRVAAQTTIDNLKYDDGTGTLATLDNSKYGVHWVFLVLDSPTRMVIVYGQAQYADVASADAAGIPTDLPHEVRPYSTGVLIAKIVVKKSATNLHSVSNPFTTRFTSSVATTHNGLAGLQGGTTDEYYHLTAAQDTLVAGATSLNTPSTLVERDASGNFAAGTITAALTGTASGNEPSGAVSSHADLTTGVHGVGAGTVAKTSDIPALSSSTPANLGTAAVGVGTTTARADHVHNMPSAGDVGAVATNNAITPATKTKITYDAKGLVTVGADATAADVGALAQTDWNKIDRCGFVDLTQCSISFEASNQTLTITGTTWQYFRAGILYTISGNKTKALTSDTAGTYFFYIDATDGTISYSTVSWTLLDTKIPVAIVIYGKTTTPTYIIADERHQCLIDRRLHWYEHMTGGTKWISGGVLADYSVAQASPTDAENTFSISEALIADEDMRHTLAEMTNPSGTGTDYLILYRTDASTWTWETSAVPFRYTSAGYIQYDSSGTMKQGAQTKAYNTYLAFTNAAEQQARHIIIHGRQEFANATAAYAEDVRNFSLTGLPFAEMVIVYQLTWETGSSYSTKGKCRLARAPQRINTSVTAVNNPAQSSDHNSLLNLQGGASASSEYYHLTSANATAVGAATDANTASAIVKRDASGNFAAGTITATTFSGALTGTASGNIPAVTPGASGNILTSNGSAWTSVTPSTGVYQTTFTSSNLSNGILTVTHNLGQRPLFVTCMDASANPVDVSALPVYTSVNAFTMDCSNLGVSSSAWTIIVSKGAGASVAAGFTNPMTTAGDLITATTGGTPARLAKGSGLQVLRMNSGGTALEYATPSAGGIFTLVSRVNVLVATDNIAFTSLNGDVDRRYYIYISLKCATSGDHKCYVKINSDTTSGHYLQTYSWSRTSTGADNHSTDPGIILINTQGAYQNSAELTLNAVSGTMRSYFGQVVIGTSSSPPFNCQIAGNYTDGSTESTNITGLTIYHDTAGAIAAGSYAELWKLAQ